MTQNINIKFTIMTITGKIKTGFLVAAMMFASTTQAQETNTAENYDQGFRLGVGLNAGYCKQMIHTNFPWS
jgi:hypothetical protein